MVSQLDRVSARCTTADGGRQMANESCEHCGTLITECPRSRSAMADFLLPELRERIRTGTAGTERGPDDPDLGRFRLWGDLLERTTARLLAEQRDRTRGDNEQRHEKRERA